MSETKTFEELFLSQSEEENLKVKQIKILIVNNINSNYMYLIKLKEWQIQHKEYFNYLFYLGNFLSYDEDKDKNDIKEISNDEAEIGGLLSYLENLSLNIVYLGGKNDCPTLFKAPFPSLTLRSVNLHENFYKLAEDLYLIGYGGNISTSTEKTNNPIENIFYKFHEYIRDNNKPKKIQTIFMCNDGSYENSKNKENTFENVMKNKKNNIFINLNGNIKMKKGNQKIWDINIINPGSICEGEIGILILERGINNTWKIKEMNFLSI